MEAERSVDWRAKGTVYVACNCDYGCPCNFNALPTTGACEGEWTWAIAEGDYGEVPLAGVTFTLAVKWPGAIHEGNGHGVLLVDERADEGQREVVTALVKGDHGGPWEILGWTWPQLDGPIAVPYEVEADGVNFRIRAGEHFEVESEPIRNPVSGAEIHPGAVLPEGLVFKEALFGSSAVYRVSSTIAIEETGKYTAVAPFEYSGP